MECDTAAVVVNSRTCSSSARDISSYNHLSQVQRATIILTLTLQEGLNLRVIGRKELEAFPRTGLSTSLGSHAKSI